jgi:uncharacterized protein
VRFWDTSAIVPLLVGQESSARALELLSDDSGMVVWWGTLIECWSALARLRRGGFITPKVETEAVRQLDTLSASWYEVAASREVRRNAQRLLRMHALRAADALQIAAALVWSGHPAGGEFVSFDSGITAAAHLEGFHVA